MDEFKWKRVREWESFIVRGVRKWLCWWFRFITYSLSCEIEKSDGVFLSRGAGGGVRTRTRVSQCYALNLFIWGFCSSCKYLAVHQRVREKAMKFLFIRDNHFFLRISHSFATRHCVKLYEWTNNKSSFCCALNCPFFIASSTTTYQLWINAFKLSVGQKW